MKSLIYVAVGLVIIGALFWAFKPDSAGNSHDMSNTFVLIVKDKKLVSGPEVLQVHQGDTVTIHITSDVAEELHVHGYDKSIDLEKDVQVELVFVADMTGRFPYELEQSKIELGALEVLPN